MPGRYWQSSYAWWMAIQISLTHWRQCGGYQCRAKRWNTPCSPQANPWVMSMLLVLLTPSGLCSPSFLSLSLIFNTTSPALTWDPSPLHSILSQPSSQQILLFSLTFGKVVCIQTFCAIQLSFKPWSLASVCILLELLSLWSLFTSQL